MDRCKVERPELLDADAEYRHRVACHLEEAS
jgi:hypothetical protein